MQKYEQDLCRMYVGTTAVLLLRAGAAGGPVNICRCSIMDPDYEFYNYYSRCRLNI